MEELKDVKENKPKETEKEIDLRALLIILKRHLFSLVLVTLVCASVFYLFSRFFITKQYEASATLIVNNLSSDKSTSFNNSELMAAQDLADVYSIIIKSDSVMKTVIKELDLNVTSDDLKKDITVSTVNSTQIIEVTMRNVDATYARKVIAKIVEVAPPIIQTKVAAGSVKIISAARVTNGGAPVSPNNFRNALIGAVLGFLVTLAIVAVRELTNNTFKTEDDISKILDIPLLGVIPAVDTKSFNKSV
ncbi:MAG: hypothetical protein IJ192_07050 [Clostridia bacterium]|nr:hypothetical protein [Clostridia bacterium]